ncbi:MAG: indolepyruvate oxidoreductase subunit beta [Clostridiales bacterium]|jgi:indolepyruvate ferredoxin oxidoreductase beta subunit|nr:indolepyruvate oxidoreductase subunit beta [Clostridiales bacterium]
MSGTNIMIVGVGGQGTLLASRVVGGAAISAGFDVKVSEVHGMSQRGGAVVTYVKYSRQTVSSPIIGLGGADLVLAFEPLEALRSAAFLKPGGAVITNTRRVDPMPVVVGVAEYPEGIADKLRALGFDVAEADAAGIAAECGSQKAANIVMIGLLAARRADFSKAEWLAAVEASVPKRFLDVNIRAFEAGYAVGS